MPIQKLDQHVKVHTFHLFPWTDVDTLEQAEWPFEDVPYDAERAREFYENSFEMIERAEELGLDGAVFNEHHYSAYAMDPAPTLLASHLAARTETMSLGFLGNVVPIRGNPIRLAEELAVLDTISGGRVIAGMARGIPMEYLAYNVQDGPPGDGPDRSREMFAEAVDLIVKAWTAEEPFDFDGEFWQYENVYVWPKPYQDPHPPMWMPASSDPSIRIAAKHRIGIARPGDPEMARTGYETYARFAEEEFGWTPTVEKFVMPKAVFVGQSREEAREAIREHMAFAREYLFGGVHRGATAKMAGDEKWDPAKHRDKLAPHAVEFLDFDYDAAVDAGTIVVGEPEHVVAELERQYEQIGGIGHLVCTLHHGDAPHDATMESLELFGEEILPELHRLD